MDNLTLPNEIIAVSRVDFNGEEWNYIVLSKDEVVNNEQKFKVNWWSLSMNYYWTKYNMSFTNALNRFLLKVKPNMTNIINNINEKTKYTDYRKYMFEKLNHLLKLLEDGLLVEEDINDLIDELT